jgi:predicted RNA binding protein YcfA (HicA-like mRNA interferase family)
MATLGKPQFQPCAHWRCASPLTASITGRKSPHSFRESSPSHESLASGQGERLLAALTRIGWKTAWQNGSHRRLTRPGFANYTFAFHDQEEVGPGLLSQIAKKTGLRPEDL